MSDAQLAYKVGDVVKFVGVNNVGDNIPSFQTENAAPRNELVLEGKNIVGERYFREWAKITWVSAAYYVASYHDIDGTEVRVAFSKTKLELVREGTDKSKIDFTKLDRIVVAPEVREDIVSVLKQHKYSNKLFQEWGLGEIMEYGRGMTMMFYGPPGTGKTGMARVIAEAMGKELSIISAAEIQSSEPGGANRAIQEAFKNAKAKNMILFLDECDSLIQSRADLGMILASEVNTLLTEIERFEGVCILATNQVTRLDEALERRISLIVEFPRPTEAQRRVIWKTMLPEKLPLHEDVIIEELAKHDYSGGEIKNIILSSARLAISSESEKVAMVHMTAAMERLAKSRGLMGSKSNYDQRAREDYQVGKGTLSKKRAPDLSSFLQEEADKRKDEDVDISTNDK